MDLLQVLQGSRGIAGVAGAFTRGSLTANVRLRVKQKAYLYFHFRCNSLLSEVLWRVELYHRLADFALEVVHLIYHIVMLVCFIVC